VSHSDSAREQPRTIVYVCQIILHHIPSMCVVRLRHCPLSHFF
jgi:hypothetical protein